MVMMVIMLADKVFAIAARFIRKKSSETPKTPVSDMIIKLTSNILKAFK